MSNFLVSQVRKLLAGRTVWALGDQGIVSLGNFAVNIILARNVSPTDFGIYALVFSFFLLLNGLHGSFIDYPMTIRLAREKHDVARQTGLALMVGAIAVVPLTLAVAVLFIVIDRPEIIPWAIFAFVAWRLQDVVRRSLMGQLRHAEAVPGDAISYLGQGIAMLALLYLDILTLEAVFFVMGMTSSLALIVQALQVKPQLSGLSGAMVFVKDGWELGRWVVMRRVVATIEAQGIGWVLAGVHGLEATAGFRAAVNLLAVTHPISQGIGNLVLPSVAHAHRRSINEVVRVSWLLGLQGGVLVFPYFFLLLFVPSFALELIYGADSPYIMMSDVVVIIVISYMMTYVSRIMAGTLAGLAKPKLTFQAALYGSIAAIFVSLPMAALGGVYYAAIGKIVSNSVRLISSTLFVRREVAREANGLALQGSVGDAR
ncbi:MAG: hypothetical protein ACFCUQ_01160 [Kiloniellales bacterium]